MQLRQSSAYSDLQMNSPFLADTRRLTEKLATEHAELAALRARILWANPDDVVLPESYDTDYAPDVADETDHKSVCKPREDYELPWLFVENEELE